MDKADALALAAIKFEVIPVDKDGVAGEAVSSSVVINSDSNVLVGKPVEADKQFNASEAGSMLTDGDLLTKWCADGVSEEDPRVAIIDMNARIGSNCRIGIDNIPRPDGDFDLYSIHDGIIVINKNAVIPDGTVI